MTNHMAPRRTHTKSRKGCQECKRRKVKCDEGTPACFNCARRGMICSLSTAASAPATSPDSCSLSDSDRRRTSGAAGLPGTAGPGLLSVELAHPCLTPRLSIAETWGQGLELMHHYCTVTAPSMAYRLDMQHVWRTVLPGLAYASPFLMHGILAAAAMHKAHLLLARRRAYADLAVYHQTAGLEGFRAALTKLDAGATDWEPSFCFAAIMVLTMCWQPAGSHGEAGDGQPVALTPGALDLFVFIRGVWAVMEPSEAQILDTPLAPLAGHGLSHRLDPSSFNKSTLRFSILPEDMFDALDDTSTFYETTLDGPSRHDYVNAVHLLRRAVWLVAGAGAQPESHMVMFIPYKVEDGLRLDIVACRPHAMVFLAHFAVLLRALETRFWYFGGLAKRMFAVVDESLARFPVHLHAVLWQRRHVFESYES
ncbi:hypothetical protein VD0002_g1091 [Verticillium dahliae]|nr:hypothetical protein VD0002_g1091 [Verticillium dahliae]